MILKFLLKQWFPNFNYPKWGNLKMLEGKLISSPPLPILFERREFLAKFVILVTGQKV